MKRGVVWRGVARRGVLVFCRDDVVQLGTSTRVTQYPSIGRYGAFVLGEFLRRVRIEVSIVPPVMSCISGNSW